MCSNQKVVRFAPRGRAGMTLVEVVVALAITGLTVGGVVEGYIYCTTAAVKGGLVQAASARAMERIEEVHSARWDTSVWPVVDQLVATNFPNKIVSLDMPGSGSGGTSATIQTTISQISLAPPIRRIRVDCIWNFMGTQLITNTIETIRAPDQ
ncbi:MAG TPA: prepilin-type N-terminal cleavage/methylation domain-containing protein [Verrucomicrobiae bacterium]|nr:prepilin-type N-terminal cleavage/methylation domain-containing protein [Verrucomicrobiae bacterium]